MKDLPSEFEVDQRCATEAHEVLIEGSLELNHLLQLPECQLINGSALEVDGRPQSCQSVWRSTIFKVIFDLQKGVENFVGSMQIAVSQHQLMEHLLKGVISNKGHQCHRE